VQLRIIGRLRAILVVRHTWIKKGVPLTRAACSMREWVITYLDLMIRNGKRKVLLKACHKLGWSFTGMCILLKIHIGDSGLILGIELPLIYTYLLGWTIPYLSSSATRQDLTIGLAYMSTGINLVDTSTRSGLRLLFLSVGLRRIPLILDLKWLICCYTDL
jgi:hypothetical protein